MEREQFQRMFALTHDDLVLGGKEIVAGQGNAGQALFAAGVGGVHLNALLRQTKEQAVNLYAPGARSKAELSKKLVQLRDLEADIRRLQLSGEQWAKQGQAATQAKQRLQELSQQSDVLAQEQLRLQRLQRTLPLLRRLAELATELNAMGQAPLLPDDFDERRRSALQRTGEATRNLESLQGKLERAKTQAGGIQVSDGWLQRAIEIGQLAERLGSHQKGQKDSIKLRADHQAHLDKLAALLTELPGKPDASAALQSIPDAGALAAMEALAPQKQALDEALRIAMQELPDCREAMAQAAGELGRLPAETDTTSLQRALKSIQRQGDLAGELSKHAKALAKDQTTAQQALVKLGLWQGELEAVATLPVPLEQTVIGFAARFRDLAEEHKRLEDRKIELQAREVALRQDLQELDSSGAIPLETDLATAREGRDEGWHLIKRRYVLGEEADLNAYAPEGNPATVYEGQVTESDQVADLLRRESQKVLLHARLDRDLQQVRDDVDGVTALLGEHEATRAALLDEWRAPWEPTGIEPLSPDEMREWLRRLDDLRAAAGRVSERRQERGAAQEALGAASASLLVELVRLGEEAGGTEEALSDLVERTEALLGTQQAKHDARAQLARQAEGGRRNEQRRQQDVAKVELALERWAAKWTGATQVLGMGEHPAVEQVAAVLRVFRELGDEHKEASALERRLKGIERDTASFEQDVERLVNELAPELAGLTPVDATRQLQSRLVAAREAQTLLVLTCVSQRTFA